MQDFIKKFTLRQQISSYAKLLGFDLVGFSPAKIEQKYLKAFEDWLEKGLHGTMNYMEKIEQRRDLGLILPGAKSVIVLGMNYYHEQKPLPSGHGRIARYAYGRDYHKVIGKKLKEIEKFVQTLSVSVQDLPILTKSYVDTGPLLERALAQQAGLGRIGKNGCLITEKFGSWIFLSEIITTLDLNFSSATSQKLSPAPSRWCDSSQKSFNVCGNCTRCMTACPTGAIIAPGIIDARLCISYLTIENKDKIPPKLAKIIAKTKRLYGCDICQEICPHNRARSAPASLRASENERSENLIPKALAAPSASAASTRTAYQLDRPPEADTFSSRTTSLFSPIAGDSLSIKKLLTKKSPLSSDTAFLQTFASSPLMRAKRKGLLRNAKILRPTP